jgi:chromosome segregation ATPase
MATITTDILAEHSAAREAAHDLALAPLVDKIAYGLARGLVIAMKELENHIASETRKVSENLGRRLDTLQASVQDLTGAVSEQRDHCRQLDAITASLKEADARQLAEIDSLRKDAGVQQEDIAAVKGSLSEFCVRVDAVVERLDKQAEALRSMYATYAQRETELEQLVDGLARLRSYPAPKSANGL